MGVVPEEHKRRGGAELRELWRKAILQQILLLRMERENHRQTHTQTDTNRHTHRHTQTQT